MHIRQKLFGLTDEKQGVFFNKKAEMQALGQGLLRRIAIFGLNERHFDHAEDARAVQLGFAILHDGQILQDLLFMRHAFGNFGKGGGIEQIDGFAVFGERVFR